MAELRWMDRRAICSVEDAAALREALRELISDIQAGAREGRAGELKTSTAGSGRRLITDDPGRPRANVRNLLSLF
jgi:hypothetical protein